MSGIYINGMEMPKKGEYRMTLYVCDDGYAYMDVDLFPVDKDRFEAVPVPKHGRLIDADKIGLTNFEIILCQKGNPFKNALEMLLKKIENAPTIIEAEEEMK